MGLFCMSISSRWQVAHDILGATDTESDVYEQGINLAEMVVCGIRPGRFFGGDHFPVAGSGLVGQMDPMWFPCCWAAWDC